MNPEQFEQLMGSLNVIRIILACIFAFGIGAYICILRRMR